MGKWWHGAVLLFIVLLNSSVVTAESTPRMNRLANEASPYLRQHATNPVDWYPWGDEALERARRENKPIFLSIGYSTCHWCHVMERESFENREVAAILNKYFIAIKVDRESRPDLDETYMLAAQIITRRGGWPNNVFLTPDARPFYAGTYWPREMFMRVLEAVNVEWRDNRAALIASADKISTIIRDYASRRADAAKITSASLEEVTASLLKNYDDMQGGFGPAPKFPHEPTLLFLLHRALKTWNEKALEAASFTLEAMNRGGIHDQIGGGFHRYSTDNEWLVPHFEKMLYNQAQLLRAFSRAWALTGQRNHARAARRIIAYVTTDLQAPDGGWYSARDADSEGGEGTFYLWTPAQVKAALPAADATLVTEMFGIDEDGNFEGRSIAHLTRSLKEWAAEKSSDEHVFEKRIDALLATLASVRARREQPHRDEKIVLAWNGMMLTALAEAGELFGDERIIQAAARNAGSLWQRMHRGKGRLWRVLFEGKPSIDGQQEDYAYFAQGLLALYDATDDAVWLERAMQVTDAMIELFADKEAGDYFLTEQGGPLGRTKLRTDGAIASGNAVALEVLSKLSRRSDKPDYALKAGALLAALSGLALEQPVMHEYALMAMDEYLFGETGPRRYAGQGHVRAEARLAGRDRIEVRLRIAGGWHVNAHKLNEKDLVPTTLKPAPQPGWTFGKVVYPPSVTRVLGFSDTPLALYEGSGVVLTLPVTARPGNGQGVLRLSLQVQTCSNTLCLEPEELVLSLPVSAATATLTD